MTGPAVDFTRPGGPDRAMRLVSAELEVIVSALTGLRDAAAHPDDPASRRAATEGFTAAAGASRRAAAIYDQLAAWARDGTGAPGPPDHHHQGDQRD